MWKNLDQAAIHYGVSRRTVERHIDVGKIQSKMEDGRRLAWCVDSQPTDTETAITTLELQVEQLQDRVGQLTDTMTEERLRHEQMLLAKDAIILELSRSNQLLLETSQTSIWQKILTPFRRSV